MSKIVLVQTSSRASLSLCDFWRFFWPMIFSIIKRMSSPIIRQHCFSFSKLLLLFLNKWLKPQKLANKEYLLLISTLSTGSRKCYCDCTAEPMDPEATHPDSNSALPPLIVSMTLGTYLTTFASVFLSIKLGIITTSEDCKTFQMRD